MANQIIFATTSLPEDDELASVVATEKIPIFRGDNKDVVKRYVDAAKTFKIEYVVRVTGDCPFVDGETLDYCLAKCNELKYFDLATTKSAFPIGIDYEIYRSCVIAQLHAGNVLTKSDREHLIKYIYDHYSKFNIKLIKPLPRWTFNDKSFTVDTIRDYKFSKKIVGKFSNIYFTVDQLIKKVRE